MPLQTLPFEVIYLILEFVGSATFRKQEACCLLVSKWWYNVAEQVLLKEFVLNANQLDKIPEIAFQRLSSHVQRLTVLTTHAADVYRNDKLNDVLNQFLPRCVHLKAFSLRAQSDFDPHHPLAPAINYLESWSPTRLFDTLDLSTVSDLVIDTCGSRFQSGVHICPRVLKIPSLRSIRLRMQHVCPREIELVSNSNMESIIINISLIEPDRFHAGFSRHCTESMTAYDLYEEMVVAATKFADSHPDIKTLRILSHKHPYSETVTTDCIKGTKMILSDENENWSDDGLPDPDDEDVSDQDLFTAESEDEAPTALDPLLV